MIHFSLILEDTILNATVRYQKGSEPDPYVVDVVACDNLSGESGKAIWTKEQWQAVLLLIADADDQILGVMVIKALYEIAKPAIEMLPESCRPIP